MDCRSCKYSCKRQQARHRDARFNTIVIECRQGKKIVSGTVR